MPPEPPASPTPTLDLRAELPFILFLTALFLAYGQLVRRGALRGRWILIAGILMGLVAVVVSTGHFWRPGMPLPLQLINPLMMALCTGFCVSVALRSQTVRTVAEETFHGTPLTVLSCAPLRIPAADALLVATSTELRTPGGPAAQLAQVGGKDYDTLLSKGAPVGVGKIVITPGDRLPAPKVYHAAVYEARKNMNAENLRRGMQAAAHQAHKNGAKTLTVACGKMPGLSLTESATAIVTGVLKHAQDFEKIVFCAIEGVGTQPLISAVHNAVTKIKEMKVEAQV
jgi:O-acetyl-ADP-ribose deacetylase (regulator of RNase III)